MTCTGTRECLYAFLDGELDAALSIELQRHLDHCPLCAREAEIERVIRRQLSRVMDAPELNQAVEMPLRRMLAADAAKRHPRGMLRPLTLTGLAVAVLLAVVAAWHAVRGGAGHERTSAFAESLVADFEKFVGSGRPLEFSSSDPQAVAAWLREQALLDPGVTRISSQRFTLVGARSCKVAGRPAAFALYEVSGRPASVLALGGTHADLLGMRAVLQDGGYQHWAYRCRDCTVVACVVDGVVLAAVGPQSESELLSLLDMAPAG